MAKKAGENVEEKYVTRGGMDGWYKVTVTKWFTPDASGNLCFGGLTYQEAYKILTYLEYFVGEIFGGRMGKELSGKLKEAIKELREIREETKDIEYSNKFTARDDGYPD